MRELPAKAGRYPAPQPMKCSGECNGEGRIDVRAPAKPQDIDERWYEIPCPDCDGAGTHEPLCEWCGEEATRWNPLRKDTPIATASGEARVADLHVYGCPEELATTCEGCGERGTRSDPVNLHVLTPPAAGFRWEEARMHARCAAEAARRMVE